MLIFNNISDSSKNIALNLFKVFICFTIYFNSVSYAHASVAGWSLSDPISEGASTLYKGTKKVLINGKEYIKKGVVSITPTANQVAKVLARGGAAYALSVAVEQLLGGVDWILDPENNQIKYTEAGGDVYSYYHCKGALNQTFKSCVEERLNSYFLAVSSPFKDTQCTLTSVVSGSFRIYRCTILDTRSNNRSAYGDITVTKTGDKEQDTEKTLPLPTVAAKVISNANANDNNAKVATTSAAADIVAEAEKDNTKARPIADQLEQSSSTENTDADAQSKSNTANGSSTTKNETTGETTATDLALEFPTFCGWAPLVCESAQVVISFPNTLIEWWEISTKEIKKAYLYAESLVQDVKDYFKEEQKQEEKTDIQIEDIPEVTEKVNVSIGDNTCPSLPVSIHTPFNNIQTDISPVYLCEMAGAMKAFFIALGFYHASLIVGRRN